MDALRYEQFKTSVKFGGLPGVKNETFTKEQKSELEELLKQRSKDSLEFIKSLKIEGASLPEEIK